MVFCRISGLKTKVAYTAFLNRVGRFEAAVKEKYCTTPIFPLLLPVGQAIQTMVVRNEILKTVFKMVDSKNFKRKNNKLRVEIPNESELNLFFVFELESQGE